MKIHHFFFMSNCFGSLMSGSQHSLFIVIKSKQNLMQSNFHSNSGRRLDGLNPPGFSGTDYSVLHSFRITKCTSGLILLGFAGSCLRYTEGILTLHLASVLKLYFTEMGTRVHSNSKCNIWTRAQETSDSFWDSWTVIILPFFGTLSLRKLWNVFLPFCHGNHITQERTSHISTSDDVDIMVTCPPAAAAVNVVLFNCKNVTQRDRRR